MFQVICILATLMAVSAEPPSREYLPPDQGYSYNKPNVPFPTPSQQPSTYYPLPSYRPPVTPVRPQPTYPSVQPTYPSAQPTYPSIQPTYGPPKPSYVPPPPSKPYSPLPTRPTYIPPPKPSYGPPSPYPGESGGAISPDSSGGTGGGEFDHLRQPHVPGMPYDFNYAVKDDYYGNDYAHSASSDGDIVKGEYKVLLPDGRLQIVRYTASWKDGYFADVSYQGEAQYPKQSGSAIGAPGPSYQPPGKTPSYPSPSYPSPSYPSPSYPSPSKQPVPVAGYSGSAISPDSSGSSGYSYPVPQQGY